MPSPPFRLQNAISPQTFGGNSFPEPIQWFQPDVNVSWAATQIGAGTLQLSPVIIPEPMAASVFDLFVSNSYSATNAGSSRADTVSVSVGLYSMSGATLALALSASATTAFTVTGSSSSASYQGLKALGIPFQGYVFAGNYWVGVASQLSTAGNAVAGGLSNVVASFPGGISAYNGRFGGATGNSACPLYGFGILSVTTASMPASIALSDISGSGIGATNRPIFAFRNYSA